MLADPAFLYKLLLEQATTIGCSVWWEVKTRKERLKKEWDLALINVLTVTACNAVVVWSLAPCRSYGSTFRFDLQNTLQKLPNNIFEKSYPSREFDLQKRVQSFFYKAVQLSMVGSATGAIQGALSNLAASKKEERDGVSLDEQIMNSTHHDESAPQIRSENEANAARRIFSSYNQGGASGIGLETSRVLALRKAHVIIAARNLDAANDAKNTILKDNENARVDVLKLDLSSIKSIKAFADDFNALNLPLNILINNAGIMFCPYQLSEEGFEMQFATNHLGHFCLTNLLLDKMKQTAKSSGIQGRIVNLSSVALMHTYAQGIRFDMINDKSSYSDKKAYGQSKLANILHAKELSRRLQIFSRFSPTSCGKTYLRVQPQHAMSRFIRN